MFDEKNICCPFLAIVPCNETEEHCHLVCFSDGSPMILENEQVQKRCVSDTFEDCHLFLAPKHQNIAG